METPIESILVEYIEREREKMHRLEGMLVEYEHHINELYDTIDLLKDKLKSKGEESHDDNK